ncbi:MAG: hypothetical protein RL215_1003 [Planctomycetota bacterium]|jgi:hypothetical protein
MLAAIVQRCSPGRNPVLWGLSIAVICCVITGPAIAQQSLIGSDLPGAPADYSPSGFFQGPIEIPDIARFRTLPHRMDYEPFITDVRRVFTLSDRYVPLSIRMLQEATDEEILEVAALQLYRIAREKMADTSSAGEALLGVYGKSSSRRVRSACMLALAAGGISSAAAEIAAYSATAPDSERLILEPVLASWNFEPAREMWRERLSSSNVSSTAINLACEGLTALNDGESVAVFLQLATDSTRDYLTRHSAARAASRLQPDQCIAAAELLMQRGQPERLIAIALLDSNLQESLSRTITLCSDAADAVASAAWQQAFRHQPELLQPLIEQGMVHRDANVRMTAARVMRQYPNPDRVVRLHQLRSDLHIQVRNTARQMLERVAVEQPPLRDQIIGLAVDSLNPDSRDWQGIEQSLVLLGQLRESTFSPQCLALLNYPRNEVMVSAAWLIHLFPDLAVREQVLQATLEAEKWIYDPKEEPRTHGLKQALLFQYLGILRVAEIESVLEKQFNKQVPGGEERRGASMWALGLLHEKKPDQSLINRFHERIQDRSSPRPEGAPVRRNSLLALGMMRANNPGTHAVVKESMVMDSATERVRGTTRWVHPLVGLELPPPIPDYQYAIGGWRLNPIED